ncbi:uncharacterized protein LOC131157881 [Malania oleifera]|uniref:uncharacterized protein LOC131157881 n=1 Tax=Malania oleifera TaxID=397392 RepID=UPI0025ADACB8|nr:uncharacterized protein LOC131157881 [Malania oleifera]
MAEQVEDIITGLEQGQKEFNDKMSKIMDLLMGKGKVVRLQDKEEDSDPAHPPGFTLVHGQTSAQSPVATENSLLNSASFIPIAPMPRIPIVGVPPIMMTDAGVRKIATEHRCDVLEERLRAIEGSNSFFFVNPVDLYLVRKVVLPPKFKIPDFEKFDGTWCPQTHLRLYCKVMAAYFDNEKLMMHCFQSSLIGSAIRWYIQQNRTRVHTWKDLANAFLVQYCHMVEMVPNRVTLQEMEKKPLKTFREYAYQWRDITIQVDPLVNDSEAIFLFVETLKDPYYGYLRGATPHNFMDIVAIEGRIEVDIKACLIKDGNVETGPSKKWTNRKKDEEAQMVQGHYYQSRRN